MEGPRKVGTVHTLRQFVEYLKLLAKEWSTWVVTAVDLIMLGTGLLWPSLTFPPILLWVVALLGLVWVSFRVYIKAIPSPALSPPKITVQMIEGNEYSYSLIPGRMEEPSDLLPEASLCFHVRLRNDSAEAFHVLSMEGQVRAIELKSALVPYYLTFTRMEDNDAGLYPILLEPGASPVYDLATWEHFRHYNPAQLAAALSELPSDVDHLEVVVTVEAKADERKVDRFTTRRRVSLTPLKNLIIERWRDLGRTDLVELAES